MAFRSVSNRAYSVGRVRSLAVAVLFCAMLGTASLVAPAPCLADDSRLGRTPLGVYPLQEPAVTMLEEWVRVEVQSDTYKARVSCEFVFANEGPARTLLMGFPSKLPDQFGEPWHTLEVKDFQATLDGIPLAVAREPGVSAPGDLWPLQVLEWVTFEVSFAAGQVRRLGHTYHIYLPGDSSGENRLGYVLTTGALWAKPIGHARVEFAMGPVRPWHLTTMFPASFVYEEENTWVWEASDFRPEYDLRITYNLRGWPEDPGGAEIYPETAEWREEFDAVNRHVAEPQWLLSCYRQVQARVGDEQSGYWLRQAVLARYIASKIPAAIRPGPAAPEIIGLSAGPATAGPGVWLFSARAIDRDCDLVVLRLDAVREQSGERTVLASSEWRLDPPEWPCPRADVRLLAPPPDLRGLFLQATAVDVAGNVTAGELIQARALTGGISPGAVAAGVAFSVAAAAAAVLWYRRVRRKAAAHR